MIFDVLWSCDPFIEQGYSEADSEGLRSMMHDKSNIACDLNHLAARTNEWKCLEACEDYVRQFRKLYCELDAKLDQF